MIGPGGNKDETELSGNGPKEDGAIKPGAASTAVVSDGPQ